MPSDARWVQKMRGPDHGSQSRFLPRIILLWILLCVIDGQGVVYSFYRQSATSQQPEVDRWTFNGFAETDTQVLTIDPTNPSTIYAGVRVNGLQKSTDSGQTWEKIDPGGGANFYAIEIPSKETQTIYLAKDRGLFKSLDAGATWRQLTNGLGNVEAIQDVEVDPLNNNRVYAATTTGLSLSTDAGGSWQQIFQSGGNEELEINPQNPGIMYFLADPGGGFSEKVLKSTDAGQSWSVVANGLEEIRFLYAMALDPNQPQNLYVGGTDGVYKSTNGGETFKPANKRLEGKIIITLAFDTLDQTSLFAGGSREGGLFYTKDGGANWADFTNGLPPPFVISILPVPQIQTIFTGVRNGLYWRKLLTEQPDTIPPQVQVLAPNGQDVLRPNSRFAIAWNAIDDIQVVSQDIALSLDSGATYSMPIATDLAGDASRFTWTTPREIKTQFARIKITARDAAGNVGSDTSDEDFGVYESQVRLSVSPNAQIVKGGGSVTYKVQIEREFYPEVVNLSVTDVPAGVTASLAEVATREREVSLRVDTSEATELGTYQMTVRGVGTGVEIEPTSLLLTVSKEGDFVLSLATSAPQVLAPGDTVVTQIGVQAVEGFGEKVQLKAMIAPAEGLEVRFSPGEIGAGESAVMTIESEAGVIPNVYVISVIGQASSATRQMTVIANVGTEGNPDFSFILNPTSQATMSGGLVNFTASVEPIGEFAEEVELEALVSPPDPNIVAQIAPGSVKPKNSAVVVVTTQAGLKSGTYTVVLVGKSNQVTNTGTVTVNVQSPDYSLGFSQPELTIREGSKGTIEVKVNRTGGYSGVVTVTPDLAKVKSLKMKLTPTTGTTTGDRVTFSYKMKKNPPVGRHTLTFIGQDDRGTPPRVQTLNLVIQ